MTLEFHTQHEAADAQFARVDTVSIIATGTQSTTAYLGGRAPIRLLVPGGWSSTAAIVHFDIADTAGSYYPLWASGTAYTVAAGSGQAVSVDPTKFYGVKYIRLLGTQARGTAVAQTTACTVSVVSRLI